MNSRQQLTKILLLCLMLAITCYSKKVKLELDNSITFDAKMYEANTITFKISAPRNGWIAFAFGDRMKNQDGFIIKTVEGKSSLLDVKSLINGQVEESIQNNYRLEATSLEDHNEYRVTRTLDAKDSHEFELIDGDHSMMYAYGSLPVNLTMTEESIDDYLSSLSDITLKRYDAGEFTLMIDILKRDVGLKSPLTNPTMSKRMLMDSDTRFHALVSYLIWGIVSFFVVATGRFTKYLFATRMWVHTIFGIAILILNIAVSGIKPHESESVNTLGDNHTGIAGTVTAFTIGECVIGIAVKGAQMFLKHWTKITQWGRVLHQFWGYFCVFWGHLVVLSG